MRKTFAVTLIVFLVESIAYAQVSAMPDRGQNPLLLKGETRPLPIKILDLRTQGTGMPKMYRALDKGLQSRTPMLRPIPPLNASLLAEALRAAQARSSSTGSSQAQQPPLPTPTGTFVSLAPSQPFVSGKGWLTADNANWFAPDNISFWPHGGTTGRLNLTIQASGTFLIDFVVATINPATVCTVSPAWAPSQRIEMNASNYTQHLIVATDIPPKPADAQWIDWVVRLECNQRVDVYSVDVLNAQ